MLKSRPASSWVVLRSPRLEISPPSELEATVLEPVKYVKVPGKASYLEKECMRVQRLSQGDHKVITQGCDKDVINKVETAFNVEKLRVGPAAWNETTQAKPTPPHTCRLEKLLATRRMSY